MIPRANITAWRKTAPWPDDFTTRLLEVANPWFSGSAEISTFTLSELLATKLRALYQRKRGGDTTFRDDVPPLLRTGLDYDPDDAWSRVHDALITRLPGDPWKGRRDAS